MGPRLRWGRPSKMLRMTPARGAEKEVRMDGSVKRSEERLELLAARAYLYKVMQSLFGNSPTVEQLRLVGAATTEEALSIVASGFSELPSDFGDVSERFLAAVRLSDDDEASFLEGARSAYTRLLVGPRSLPAPPWESVYLSSNRSLFSDVTLRVRNMYRASGFLPSSYPVVSDDHLAIELDFLAKLADRMQIGYADGRDGDLLAAGEASLGFLRAHMLKWVPLFAEDMPSDGSDAFYPAAARLLVGFLSADAGFLEDLVHAQDVSSR